MKNSSLATLQPGVPVPKNAKKPKKKILYLKLWRFFMIFSKATYTKENNLSYLFKLGKKELVRYLNQNCGDLKTKLGGT
jgi:hypothetical protein